MLVANQRRKVILILKSQFQYALAVPTKTPWTQVDTLAKIFTIVDLIF